MSKFRLEKLSNLSMFTELADGRNENPNPIQFLFPGLLTTLLQGIHSPNIFHWNPLTKMQRLVGLDVACPFLERAWGGHHSGQTYFPVPRPPFLGDSQADSVLGIGALRGTQQPSMVYGLRDAPGVSFLRDFNFTLKNGREGRWRSSSQLPWGSNRSSIQSSLLPETRTFDEIIELLKKHPFPSPICRHVSICISLAGRVAWGKCCCRLHRAAPRLAQPCDAREFFSDISWHRLQRTETLDLLVKPIWEQ